MKEVWVKKASPAADTGAAEIRLTSVFGDAGLVAKRAAVIQDRALTRFALCRSSVRNSCAIDDRGLRSS